MHKAVKDFCKYVKKLHPEKFRFVNVIDFGSNDINGNNRYLLKPGGLLILTFATEGREEHGTKDHKPNDSQATLEYYHNITFDEFKDELNLYKFSFYEIKVNSDGDMMFYGIKK